MKFFRRSFSSKNFLLAITIFLSICSHGILRAETARGIVFNDQNANGERDSGEPGLRNIKVSNGLEIVTTDSEGNYQIDVDDDTILFVIKPRDWQTPVDEQNLLQFYYIHKPDGSPDQGYKYAGVEPTGDLPKSVDFPLVASPDPDEFTMIVMGDPQPATRQQVRFYANDVIAELIDSPALFGMSMGDIVHNDLSLFEPVNAVQGLVGKPWYNVLGNHDINFDSPDDKYSDETFERVYGPPNYAFQYGEVHFVVLDNVVWLGSKDNSYLGGLSDEQLDFVKTYVDGVPRDDLIVICTHIPLPEIVIDADSKPHSSPEYRKLLEILSDHPRTMSFSAHTHFTHQHFSGKEDGYTSDAGGEHHHHNVATGSGSWYKGPQDVQGLPDTTMADGAPNGYILATFKGHDYQLRFKGARMPAEYQMAIQAPEVIAAKDTVPTKIVVNVFNGNEKSKIRMRVRGHGGWQVLPQTPGYDQAYQTYQAHNRDTEREENRVLPEAKFTRHLWSAPLGVALEPGFYVLEVEATDMYGQKDHGVRLIEVE
ncbi:calcineurin-like phosphoesterase C-terminal domain-containing protein [Bythopirellula polymerisocia]|uniref:Calcineurin-like phosphoesterase n=1 Tax=Bythopirellula polymerisocia TaxID=2528003 RepID=A0A5C6CJU1_9BACT|nr:calcineurin-like phosphoesterase family protein [Bythopirellula polymerisocia]TWU23764.1 hypothetical protein Pla144_39390 [Bythopirellula polymerisocia]